MSSSYKDKILIKNYAVAFVNFIKNKQLLHIEKDIFNLKNHLHYLIKNNKYLKFIMRKDQILIGQKLLAERNYDINLKNFCMIIVNNKRIALLYNILEMIINLLDIENNIYDAQVISAVDLKDSEIQEISKSMSNSHNKNYRLTNNVDSRILAGIIIKTDSNIYDDSLMSKLHKIQNFK